MGSTPSALTNTGNYTMRLPCSQCQKVLYLGNFYEIVYGEHGYYLLCSRECKDEWVIQHLGPRDGKWYESKSRHKDTIRNLQNSLPHPEKY